MKNGSVVDHDRVTNDHRTMAGNPLSGMEHFTAHHERNVQDRASRRRKNDLSQYHSFPYHAVELMGWMNPIAAFRRKKNPPAQSFTPRGIENAARYLVQKIAREEASRLTVAIIRRQMETLKKTHPTSWFIRLPLSRFAENRYEHAMHIRQIATIDLRRELGLPDEASQLEVNGWGEAP